MSNVAQPAQQIKIDVSVLDQCPYCQEIQTSLATELAQNPEVRHIAVEDG